MVRRFLTAEDVRRASGAEIVVDRETVVTPQALAAARATGKSIRTDGGGAWSEPQPDRGPDAARSLEELPHLPEPHDPLADTAVVVTAVGRNRPGVLAELTQVLAAFEASVHDISQKMVEGELFHLVLTVEMPAGRSFHELKQALESLGGEGDYVVRVVHERVFRFMHRI